MATISYPDILKRRNALVLVERIKNKGSFRLRVENGEVLVCTGKARITYNSKQSPLVLDESNIKAFIQNKKTSDKLEVEVMNKSSRVWMLLTTFFKDKEFGGVGGKSTGSGSERQELGLINILNENAVSGNNHYVRSLGKDKKILSATKNEGLSSLRQEPYIDVFITTHDKKRYGISMKGDSAPSLAGGGLIGIKASAPELLDKMYAAVIAYIKSVGLKDGDVVNADLIPDMYVRIPDKYVKMILVGNEAMGGPVDYMYIGPMNVTATVNSNTGEITPNGKFYSIDEYMKKVPDFYFRIRKRDIQSDGQMRITFNKKNKEGYPLIFSTTQTSKNNFRLVITDKVPSTGKLLVIT